MKKSMLALLVSMVTLCGISAAMEIPVTELTGQTSCNLNETENIKLYLTSNGVIRNPGDVFGNNTDSLIGGGNNGSSINIWRHGVISSCNTWNRISNVVDGGDSNGALIFLNTDNCVFNIPNYTKISNPTAIDAQIHFTVGYRLIYSGGPNSMTDKFYHRDYGINEWTCYPNGNTVSNYNSCSNTTVKYGSKKSHTGECINYRVFWCGDGLVNSPYGTSYDNGTHVEQCDPNDPTHTNWGDGGCDPITCQTVNNPPLCNSQYNGSGYYTLFYTGSWLNSSMSTLCANGTVTNFQPNPIPTNPTSPIQYTWSCTTTGGETTGCNAVQMWCGDGVIQTQYGEQCEPGLPINGKNSPLDYLKDLLNQQGFAGGKGTNTSSTTSTRSESGYSCNSLCQLVQNPQCSSIYSGVQYTISYTGPWLNSQIADLCSGGTVTDFSTNPNPIPTNPTSPISYTWSCTTGGITITGCNAAQQWCGDGQLNGSEQCDPNDSTHQGWGNGGCSNTCQPITVNPQCNSQYNGQVIYTGDSTPYLNQWMTTLCTDGSVTDFQYAGTPIQYTWSCTSGGVTTTGCNAVQQWCGDGQLQTNYGEQCDPNDPTHQGWGNGGCSNTCQPATVNPQCNSQYNGQVIYTGDSTPYLNQWMTTLCTDGSVTDFQYAGTPIQYTWSCTSGGVTTTGCNAVQQWCGDGQLQTNYGEQCDPNDPTHTGWGNGGCSNTCQPATVNPQCNSQYNGQVIYTGDSTPYLNQWMTTLCTDGSVTDFQYAGTPIQYTWSCTSGGVTTTGCNAVQQWCGDGQLQTNYGEQCDPNDPTHTGWGNGGCSNICQPITHTTSTGHLVIDKTLVGSGLISNTGDTVVWKIRVTAVSGDVTNFTIKDILPSILGYTDYYVLHNPGLSISNPTTTQTTNGLEIKWDVIGTLTQGNYIEIQVNTYAMQMPNPYVTYKNVGCVTYNNTELCDPEPIPGHLEILKTLIGSGLISNTGDIVTWRIRVTAIGESFSGFDIIDRLPSILSYDSYTVIHNGGLTISNPIISGNEVIWTPTGTLGTGDYVEIELQTRANGMPEGGYVNVACVSGDWIGEICNSVRIGNVKIEKTLVGDRIITNTGDIITWNIVVTALSGNVTNPIITDILPSILSYSGYSVIISGGLNVSSPTISGNEIEWNTQGTLLEGTQIVIRLVTYVTEMPDHDYENVACVRYDEHGNVITCDDEDLPAPRLRIKKTFIDGTTGKQVQAGDEIVYKITFGNSGDAAATITSIKDFLPNTVEYSGSVIFISGTYVQEYMTGWSGVVHSGYSVQGIYLDIFTGITLNPGDSGYIILTGRVLTGTNQDNRTNFACIYLNGNNVDCDDVTHEYGSLMCMPPEIATNSFSNAGGSTTVVCKTSPLGSNAAIELDCGNGTVLSGTNISELSGTCTYPSNSSSSAMSYTVKCTVNGTGNCQGTVTVDKPGTPGCFPVGTKVTMADGSKKNIEKIEVGDKVLSYNTYTNTNEFSIVRRKIVHTNHIHEMYELTINGEILKVTDVHPFYVRKSDSSKDYDWIEAQNLKAGDILLMSNGNLVEIEKITHYNNQETVYNLEVQGNHDYFVDKGYLVHNKGGGGGPSCSSITTNPSTTTNLPSGTDVEVTCNATSNAYILIDCNYSDGNNYGGENNNVYISSGRVTTFTRICHNYTQDSRIQCLIRSNENNSWQSAVSKCGKNVTIKGGGGGGGGSDPIYDQAECFNVNTNQVSIEQGEILPFFWNIKNVKNIKNWAVVLDDGDNAFKDKVEDITVDVVEKYEGKSCDENNSIALNSMICKFKIRNGKEIVKEAQFPCLRDTHGHGENWVSNIKLLDAWMKYWKTYYQGNSDHFFRSFSNKDRTYALRSNLNYIENFGMNQEWLGEYKISLTDIQYLQCRDNKWTVQHPDINHCENDFAVTNSYTVQKTPSGNLKASTTVLSKYLYMNGNKLMSDLLNAIATTEYEPNNTVSKAMQSFKNKYEKLAVNIGEGTKKVPGKSIYFIEGNKTIRDGDFTKPVTFIQTNPNATITIKGSITNLNMMILTEGTIKFEDTNSCNNRQVVKGIFYAGSKLIRTPVEKNTSLSNDKWCTGGGLTIKGVLIGKGLQQMMNNSRSNLNNWFSADSNDKRKRVVMDGASVLIEYSPSVFTTATMPPGAEYFTTALSIYKN